MQIEVGDLTFLSNHHDLHLHAAEELVSGAQSTKRACRRWVLQSATSVNVGCRLLPITQEQCTRIGYMMATRTNISMQPTR